MKLFLFAFIYFACLTAISANETKQEFYPTILVVDKNSISYDNIISDLLTLQESLVYDARDIPETILQTGFLLVPMTPEYVVSLLIQKEGQIICAYLDQSLLGYMILTHASEFEELYQDIHTGKFETTIKLSDLRLWLSDPAVGYIEQIGIKPGYFRKGIGSRLIQACKTLKPHGLVSDVFVYPVQNRPSLHFFSRQGFFSSGVLYQSPGANINFPYDHRTQVFFWYGKI